MQVFCFKASKNTSFSALPGNELTLPMNLLSHDGYSINNLHTSAVRYTVTAANLRQEMTC